MCERYSDVYYACLLVYVDAGVGRSRTTVWFVVGYKVTKGEQYVGCQMISVYEAIFVHCMYGSLVACMIHHDEEDIFGVLLLVFVVHSCISIIQVGRRQPVLVLY